MNTIISMKHAMIEAEYVRDVQAAEQARANVARADALAICEALREYFSAKAWTVWCDAIPDDVYEFREYAQAEAENCAAETAKIAEWINPNHSEEDQAAWDEFVAETEATRRMDYPR